MGFPKYRPHELDIIRKWHGKKTAAEISEMLPNRNKQSVHFQACKMKKSGRFHVTENYETTMAHAVEVNPVLKWAGW